MADIFSVIADPTRRHVLSLLLPLGEVSVSELVSQLELSQPTVSKHLKVLRDAGLVTVREVGQHRYYALDASPLEGVEDWLVPFLSVGLDDAAEPDDDDSAGGGDDVDVVDHAKSQASLVGERVGQSVASATGRARSIFEEVTRRIPNISRSSD